MNTISETQIKEFIDIMSKTRRMIFEMHHSFDDQKTTALQFRGLMLLEKNPGITVGELADRFMMSSAAIAQYLNRLEKSGLIEKQTDQDDKRISRIFVSDKGRKELKPIKKVFSERFGEILSPLTRGIRSTYRASSEDIS